jgi:hypothetical protein
MFPVSGGPRCPPNLRRAVGWIDPPFPPCGKRGGVKALSYPYHALATLPPLRTGHGSAFLRRAGPEGPVLPLCLPESLFRQTGGYGVMFRTKPEAGPDNAPDPHGIAGRGGFRRFVRGVVRDDSPAKGANIPDHQSQQRAAANLSHRYSPV